ncbi:MAG: GYD domain-containing protein [Chloroflexi bacterium]|nr:MAG: GYD domain-containing protein [Chloroflexota bacterium]
MPTYVWLGRWTDQGIRNVKDTLTLTEQANAAIEKAGGRTVGVWWTHGAYDIVTVTEFPDDEAGSAFVLAAAMGGNVRIETMRAYTEEEIQRIIQKLP